MNAFTIYLAVFILITPITAFIYWLINRFEPPSPGKTILIAALMWFFGFVAQQFLTETLKRWFLKTGGYEPGTLDDPQIRKIAFEYLYTNIWYLVSFAIIVAIIMEVMRYFLFWSAQEGMSHFGLIALLGSSWGIMEVTFFYVLSLLSWVSLPEISPAIIFSFVIEAWLVFTFNTMIGIIMREAITNQVVLRTAESIAWHFLFVFLQVFSFYLLFPKYFGFTETWVFWLSLLPATLLLILLYFRVQSLGVRELIETTEEEILNEKTHGETK